jgi:multidrug efflux pump subunit AcrA (membrane-fusion protein)
MTVSFSKARSRGRWILGLGIGFLGAFVLPQVVPTLAALAQARPQRTSIEKTAPGSHGSSLASTGNVRPAIVKVEQRPLKIEVILSGVFEARRMIDVSIRPMVWPSPLLVERAIELGTPVKKGDILLEFDHDKIDKAIADSEVENTIGDLALKQAEEEVPILEKSLPVDLASALRAKTQADEDLKKFLEVDRANSERSAQFMVKRSVEFLEYAKEELRQLEKMYRSKDLTEETEEIILYHRMARSPDRAQWLARHGQEAAHSSRIALHGGRLLLLLWPLLRGTMHRPAPSRSPHLLPGPSGLDPFGASGTRRLVVGLSAL